MRHLPINWYCRALLCLAVLSLVPTNGFCQTRQPGKSDKAKKPPSQKAKQDQEKSAPKIKLTRREERQVLRFVDENHPELKPVLTTLKQKRAVDYRRAILQIKNTYERIERLKETDPAGHKIELEIWKAWSRIKLLAAKLAIKESPQVRNQLRQAIRQDRVWKQRRLQHINKIYNERIVQNNEAISKLKETDNQLLERLIKYEVNLMKPREKKKQNNKRSGKKKNLQVPANKNRDKQR